MTKRNDTVQRIAEDTAHLAIHFAAAERRLMDARPALTGGTSYDGTRGGSDTSSTEALALADDPVGPVIREVDDLLRRMAVDALRLRRLTDSWTPRHPTDRDRRDVEAANRPADDECAHHRTFGEHAPVHRTGTAGGNLEVDTPLCRWCYDRVRTDGRLPSADRMHRLALGRRDQVKAG